MTIVAIGGGVPGPIENPVIQDLGVQGIPKRLVNLRLRIHHPSPVPAPVHSDDFLVAVEDLQHHVLTPAKSVSIQLDQLTVL
jgi:hypothetical protein